VLPVQDCSKTYGGALRFLRFAELSPDRVSCDLLARNLTGGDFSVSHDEGCHTLSSCGSFSLVDTKRVVRSWTRHKINLQRHVARLGYGRLIRPLQTG
jgi:hypothetical protein